MKFNSTRGGVVGQSFEEAILSGYAEDGGILLPESIPRVSREILVSWKSLSYVDLCKEILPLFIPESEITRDEINGIVDKSFTDFENGEVVRLAELGDTRLCIGEVFHGPTGAFKDLALSVLGRCVDLVLSRRRRKVTILVGTSGDTGSAAIRSVCGSPWANIIVLYPDGMVSEIQRLQMTTVDAPNVHVYAVEGTSDDLDVPIRNVFRDLALVNEYGLCSINSINVGRVLFQCVHYIYFYLKVCGDDLERRLPVYIPTGAAGHITAGCIARRLTGLDIQLIACVNENDIMHRWLETGVFQVSSAVMPTSSNAMDIQVPYNIERLLFYLSDGDCALVKSLMDDLDKKGLFVTPPALRERASLFMTSRRVTEAERMSTMKEVSDRHSYVLCPHSAIAVKAALDDREGEGCDLSESHTCVCLATATPAKFMSAVRKAEVTVHVQQPDSWSHLKDSKERDKRMRKGEDWEAMLREAIKKSHGSTDL
ncbi:threonine synthase-like 2 [Sycon ciliatum]|uniref:threonine synthase-like 2 n=1 Tax=Sycon ciliatum TaxID=27933 RepID=UPI0020AB908B